MVTVGGETALFPTEQGPEELQRPLKSTEADRQCHLTPSIITNKDPAPFAAADMSDCNVSDYDYSHDDEGRPDLRHDAGSTCR